MIIELPDTNSAQIAGELVKARRQVGPATGMVFTLVVITCAEHADEVMDAAMSAGRAHPSRIIVVRETDIEPTSVDAELHFGEAVPGDIVILRFGKELISHADSVILPLLLPDSPTVVWWPHHSPKQLASDPVGRLATRRVTDAAGSSDPIQAIITRAKHHSPGDTDLTWTRLTAWRGLLAAALDQHPAKVTGGKVVAAADNAPALLMRAWLQARLGVTIDAETSPGPGLTVVQLDTADGPIRITREDERLAKYEVPDHPERSIALARRQITELITEELKRMDPDETFELASRELLAIQEN